MTQQFDLSRALLCARLSAAAYELDDAKRKLMVAAAGALELHYIVARHDARLLVAEAPVIGVVYAFQGTQFTKGELPSILENLRIAPVEFTGGRKVMDGYWDQLAAILPHLAMLPACDQATGHSMGGIVAQIAQLGRAAPISFGAPKGANAAFWDAAALKPLRIIRAQDFAPTWPIVTLDFIQPPPALWLHRNAAGQMTAELIIDRPGINEDVDDHGIERYIADLEELAAAALKENA